MYLRMLIILTPSTPCMFQPIQPPQISLRDFISYDNNISTADIYAAGNGYIPITDTFRGNILTILYLMQKKTKVDVVPHKKSSKFELKKSSKKNVQWCELKSTACAGWC